MHILRLLTLLAITALVGCGAAGEGAAAPSGARAATGLSSLFSDTVHDIPMPAPGRALLDFKGQTLVATMFSDCSASLEPPPEDQPWEPHLFAAEPQFELEQGSASLQFQRTILLNEDAWSSAPHEQEVISLTLPQDGEMWTYTLHRLTPSEPAMIARPMDKPAQRAHADDPAPGIRVHPEGHQATFVGRLGQTSMLETISDPGFEEVRIAIHCGPT